MGWALNIGYASALTLAAPWIALRAARTGRYRTGWAQRLLGRVPSLPRENRPIWVHGVSLGEVQLLRPLIESLQSQQSVVLSTSTLTGMQVAQKSLPRSSPFYCPLDFTWAVRQTIDRIHPSLIALGELEVWPHLIAAATEQGIPVCIVNGRLSDRSFRGYRKLNWLLRRTFSKLSMVAAQDAATAERFCQLGVPSDRVHVTGSLKFDNVNADRNHPEVEHRLRLVGLRPAHRVLVAGSTQDPEEKAVVAAVKELLPVYPQLRLIVVPRHPERFDEVYQLLLDSGLKVIRRSQLDHAVAADRWQILLVDSVGELRWWWGAAELALVGGSFGKRGGQNMLEPAAYGAKVAFGPNCSNFREIVQRLLANDAAWQLPSLECLSPWIREQLADPALGLMRPQRASELIRAHQGATERTLALIHSLLETKKQ